ncbi:YbaY family lipoprotein [Dyella telluris]|uniref:YbaY family lipoprotein n=1 Tax=Dyella telluris TaxID=2763498 RepID=A0A7G8Q1C3_9GAMM|nr:YbaY family lipoprotein [Dyella telluris]QNK00581.1 YbaY family lipoprotein [Dyella telluris]
MSFRLPLLVAGVLALSACSWLPFHHKQAATPESTTTSAPAAPVHQALMKTMIGDVRYDLPNAVPADAVLIVTLADVSRQDVAARTVSEERIQPVGPSPVDFMLSYDPADLRDGVDFAINVRLQQGEKLLAINDTRTSVLGRSSENGPVSITLKAVP